MLLVPLLPGRVVTRDDRRRSYPAACADRSWVGGLLGGLGGACHTVTPRHASGLARQDTCVLDVTDLTNRSHIND